MSSVIEGFYVGDDFNIERDVTNVTTSDPLIKAWLTIKTAKNVADPGTVQKIITTTNSPGNGHIAQDGSVGNGDGTASMRFELTAANTTTLGSSIRYVWDIQVKTQSGKISTPHEGTMLLKPGVTDATS